jgi:DNA-binding LytR/AlgR family response regulator
MNLRCIIVEDEKISRELLQNYCKKTPLLDVAGCFEQPTDALAFLKNEAVDLIFLDVEMPGLTGFQLLDQLHYSPKVVLTTSKTEYAFEAFQYEVSDYLKKPFNFIRFQQSVNKILQATSKIAPAPQEEQPQDTFIKSDGKLIRLNYEDILYVECVGDYVKYVTPDKKHLVHLTMKGVEEKMDSRIFMKVHRSYIVNTKKIQDIQDNSLLIEGRVIPISRSFKQDVLKRLKII